MYPFSLEALRGDGPFRKYWDLMVLLGIFWYAITVPIYIALDIDSMGWSLALDIAWTLFFSIDIYINFNTPYMTDGEWTTDPTLIRYRYLHSWFAVDVIATFPFDLLLLIFTVNQPWLFGTIRIIRIFKMLRLIRLKEVVIDLSSQGKESLVTDVVLDANVQIKITMLIFWVIIGMNTIACGWIKISLQYWVNDPVSEYIMGLYWTITTLTTVGYGDIIPSGNAARIYAMAVMLVGVVMYGLVIGNISTVMINNKADKIRQREKVAELASFLKDYKIPKRMQSSIFGYYNHYLFEKSANHADIVEELPKELQQEVKDYVNIFMLRHVPIFANASPGCLSEMIKCLKARTIPPDETVIRYGDVGDEMYFLNHGVVEVQMGDGVPVAKLRAGSFFGEVALLHDVPRIATVRTVTFCDLFVLKKKDFVRVMETYPRFRAEMQRISRERQA